MQLTTHAKSFEISEKLMGIITRKLEKIQTYFEDTATCTIVCLRRGKVEKIEITINQRGQIFRAEAASGNMFVNIDVALAKIEKQIIKHRDKLRTILRDESRENKKFAFYTKSPKFFASEIVKNKSFSIDKLSQEEAEIALDTSDHNFYVYANANTGKVNIIYRRTDGNLGIIEVANSKTV